MASTIFGKFDLTENDQTFFLSRFSNLPWLTLVNVRECASW